MENADKKIALVTGSSSGIGKEVAIGLAREGYIVCILASSSLKKANLVVEEIKAVGGYAKGYACDVSDYNATQSLVNRIIDDFGRLDSLVNAAGIFLPTPAGELDASAVMSMVSINLIGTINIVNAVIPRMKAQGGGKIVNFSSVSGVSGTPGFSVYAATKAGIIMLTKSLAIELAPFDINVNTIAPGNTATPMNEPLRNDEQFSEVMAGIERLTPSNISFSDPSEIAAGVLFLLSDAARPMHGSLLLMDEGISAGMKL